MATIIHYSCFLLSLTLCYRFVFCQNNDPSCLSQGGLAGVIFGCITGTLMTTVLTLFLFWRFCWTKNSSGSITEPFCYDNPQFVQNTTTTTTTTTTANSKEQIVSVNSTGDHHLPTTKVRKREFQVADSDLGYTSRTVKNKRLSANVYGVWRKTTTNDYSDYQSTESLGSIHEYFRVPLKSKDFTGLGFGIYGNMRDGIFVKSLLNKGPAKDAGKIREGDRIVGVEINFENIVLEDALTILSYASPYPVVLEVKKCTGFVKKPTLLTRPSIRSRGSERRAYFHPLVKSQSTDDMSAASRSSRRLSDAIAPLDTVLGTATVGCQIGTNLTPSSGGPEEKTLEAINNDFNAENYHQRPAPVDDIRPPVRTKRENNKMKRDIGDPTSPLTTQVQEAFPSLSHEHAMQIIRLSYEDPEVSRSAPDLFRRAEPNNKVVDVHRQENHDDDEDDDEDDDNNEDERSSRDFVDEPSRNGSTTCNPLYSTSSSEDLGEFDKEQYDKLLYFQRELVRQHEELAKLGINVPFQMNTQKYSLPTSEKY